MGLLPLSLKAAERNYVCKVTTPHSLEGQQLYPVQPRLGHLSCLASVKMKSMWMIFISRADPHSHSSSLLPC